MSAAAPLDKRGQFISARKRDIFEALRRDLGLDRYGDEPDQMFRLLTAIIHYQFLGELERLHEAYHELNPGLRRRAPHRAVDDAAYATLEAALDRVLQAANFVEVAPEELEHASKSHGRIRQPVRTSAADFRAIRLFRRGRHTETVERRSLWGLRRKEVPIEVFDEVVLLAALKPTPEKPRRWRRRNRPAPPGSVMIKCFHDIASADLDALYPEVKVVMTRKDAMMMGVPALLAGVPLLIKLAPAAFVIYGVLRFYFGIGPEAGGGIGEALIVAGGVLALGSFLVNQWMKYERRALLYQREVNETIYFHNITNNVGIFDHIIGNAEEQETKEALLAYWLLQTSAKPLTEPELDRAIEQWLERRFGLHVDFEVDDALQKLTAFGLLRRSGEHLSVVAPSEAIRVLSRRWDEFFPTNDQGSEPISVPGAA